jgi:hypothetical protein
LFRKETDGDWVTMGVLYYKAPHKSSSSGNEFSVWKLTDLRHSAQTDESRSHQIKLDYLENYHAVQPVLRIRGSETFGRIRIRSGTEINVLDPDSNPDPKLYNLYCTVLYNLGCWVRIC